MEYRTVVDLVAVEEYILLREKFSALVGDLMLELILKGVKAATVQSGPPLRATRWIRTSTELLMYLIESV